MARRPLYCTSASAEAAQKANLAQCAESVGHQAQSVHMYHRTVKPNVPEANMQHLSTTLHNYELPRSDSPVRPYKSKYP
jgi:hypothetical protein